MNTSETVLVYGATGAQGSAVVRELLKQEIPVRVIARDPAKARSLWGNQVEIAQGSFEDPQSLLAASRSIKRVFLHLPLEYRFEVATQQGFRAIDAARVEGVEFLVFNASTLVPVEETDVAAFEIKRQVEHYLQRSQIPFVILRPPVYMDNLSAPWLKPAIVQEHVVSYPMPAEMKSSWICLKDAAALSVAALERPELAGSTFAIGGPEALTGTDIAQCFERVLGQPFRYQEIPIDAFEQGLKQSFGELAGSEIGKIYRYRTAHLEVGTVDMASVLTKLPLPLTSFEDWIRQTSWIL